MPRQAPVIRRARPRPDSILIEGLDAIGRVMSRNPRTITRWIAQYGFPAAKLPDGTWATTRALIEQWILARGRIQLRERGILGASPPQDGLNDGREPDTGSDL